MDRGRDGAGGVGVGRSVAKLDDQGVRFLKPLASAQWLGQTLVCALAAYAQVVPSSALGTQLQRWQVEERFQCKWDIFVFPRLGAD
ncbi:hypothetical protein TYRP_013989 [Tyrophagus putrescentiae]|nr:hypothetical protein TYRP_013989 [Tyrophagus putrescentiae]